MRLWDEQVVPRLVDLALGNQEVHKLRARTCAGLEGRVLEIGFGSGLNVGHYPAAVSSVDAVEPNEVAWGRAAPRIAAGPVDVRRAGLDAQRLALPDASVDSALSTFTLCTVPDVEAALTEVRRVLRPGGRLHFVEHGLSPEPRVAGWQHRLAPVQHALAGGCHLDRPIARLVEEAGFRTGDLETFYAPGPKPLGYLYLGWAETD